MEKGDTEKTQKEKLDTSDWNVNNKKQRKDKGETEHAWMIIHIEKLFSLLKQQQITKKLSL